MKKTLVSLATAAVMGGLLLSNVATAATAATTPAPAANAAVSSNTNLRVGVISLGKVIEADPEVQSIKNKLQAQFKPRIVQIQSLQKQIDADQDKEKRDSAVMSDMDLAALKEKIVKEQRDLDRLQQDYMQDARLAQQEAMDKVLKSIDAIVEDIAKKNNYDLILQKNNVAFNSQRVDITDQVIARLKNGQAANAKPSTQK